MQSYQDKQLLNNLHKYMYMIIITITINILIWFGMQKIKIKKDTNECEKYL